jgi:acetyl esterase/lipase
MARFERLLARRRHYSLSAPVPLGTCSAFWLDAGGQDAGRVILYLHGGAFVAESPEAHCAMLARLCVLAGARGLYVAYRLAPEHPYPAATDDCLAGYRFLLDQGIDPARIVVAGDSAGGNLTVVTAMRARDSGLPVPAALVLLSPVLDATFSGGTMRRNDGLDPLFRSSIVHDLADCYVSEELRRHPYVSPLFGRLDGLPPALLMVGSSEILLDDSLRFASRANDVEVQVWHDMPHVFPVMEGLDEAARALEAMAGFIAQQTPVDAVVNTAPTPQAGC